MISLQEREHIQMLVSKAVRDGASQRNACKLIQISERTLQRWRQRGSQSEDQRRHRTWAPNNKLTQGERQQLLAVANCSEFSHLSPCQIVPILAQRGEYIASESTFYRVLRSNHQLAHRLASRPAQRRNKPAALRATAPGQVLSWDITYLKTTVLGQFYYLYLFLDIYSRKIVGWQIHDRESSELAAEIITVIDQQEALSSDTVILHSDNGGPMKGATMLATLQKLGVIPSFSRPSVSNDNPYSESLFKTLKYCPYYPSQPFSSLQQARQWMEEFTHWYNEQHRHSGIQFVTPAERHAGMDRAILQRRKATYEAAKKRHPYRWSGHTRNWDHNNVVYLNPGKAKKVNPDTKLKKAS